MSFSLRKLMLSVVLCLPLAAAADVFDEGTHYRSLAAAVPTSLADDSKVEVVELFWYGCPHCFRLEPVVERWLENKPANVEFVRIPAILGGSWELGARAYYTAEALGALDRIHAPLFNAMHVEKRRLQTESSLAEFFAEQGVAKEDFEKAFNSFGVATKVQRAKELGRRYRIEGVPAIIVNGKYETNGTMAGSHERMFEVVDYLVAEEANAS